MVRLFSSSALTLEFIYLIWRFCNSRGFDKIDTTTNLYILTHDTFTKTSQHEFELENGESFNILRQLRLVLSSDECQPFIGWLPSGNSFCINHIPNFVKNVLIKHFGEMDFGNFVIALKRKGFKRVSVTKFIGESVYSHKMFQLGRPDLCARMERGQEPLPKKKIEYEKIKEKKRKMLAAASAQNVVTAGGEPMQKIKMIAEDEKVKANESRSPSSPSSSEDEISFDGSGPAMAASRFLLPQAAFKRSSVNAQMDPISTAAFAGPQMAMFNAQLIHPYSMQGGMMNHMKFSNSMLQNHTMNHPAITNFSDVNFRSPYGMNDGMNGGIQSTLGYASFTPSQGMHPTLRQSNSINSLNQESMQAASNYRNMMLQQLNKGSSLQAGGGCRPVPNEHGGKSSEDLKLAMLEIDSELLKVKELKLLAMQRKLKVTLEMKEKKDDSSSK